MRLISQDGMVDVPYENVCVSINFRSKNQIIAWNYGCGDCEITAMATYSTEAKALKVMKMLRSAYNQYDFFATTYTTDLIKNMVRNFGMEEAEKITTPIFQFPLDEDVEI